MAVESASPAPAQDGQSPYQQQPDWLSVYNLVQEAHHSSGQRHANAQLPTTGNALDVQLVF